MELVGIVSAILGIVGFALFLLNLRYPNLFAFNPNMGVIQSPAISESRTPVVQIDAGNVRLEFLNPPNRIFTFGDEEVLGVTVVHKKFLFIKWKRLALNATLRDKDGVIVAEIRNGHFTINQYNAWGLVRNDSHFEIRDKYGENFLSVDIEQFDRMRLRCKFSYRGMPVKITDSGLSFGSSSMSNLTLRLQNAGSGVIGIQ